MPSLLQRLTSRGNPRRPSEMTWRGRSNTRCIGIDLDTSSIRISALGKNASRDDDNSSNSESARLSWNTYNKIPLPSFAATNGPVEISSPKQLRLWMDELVELLPRSVDGYRNVVTISMPPSWTHYEMTRDGETQTAIASCHAMFNESVFRSDAHTRCWKAGKHTDRLVLSAVSKQTTLQLARAIRSLGYEVYGVFPQGIALASAAIPMTTLDPCCVVTLGKQGGIVSMFGCNLDSDQLTGLCRRLIAPPANLAVGGAQLLPSLDEIEPWLDTVSQEVAATLAYANRLDNVRDDKRVNERPVLVAGELAAIPGLDSALASRIQKAVAVWRFACSHRPLSATVASSATIDPTAAVSLSLAYMSAKSLDGAERQ